MHANTAKKYVAKGKDEAAIENETNSRIVYEYSSDGIIWNKREISSDDTHLLKMDSSIGLSIRFYNDGQPTSYHIYNDYYQFYWNEKKKIWDLYRLVAKASN